MSSDVIQKEFDWTLELEKTVVKSLTTTFGLDFLLFKDKMGGNVDTVHKVREWQYELQTQGKSDINVSDEMRRQITNDGKNTESYKKISLNEDGSIKYKPNGKISKHDDYHSKDKSYRDRKSKERNLFESGKLTDGYTGEKLDEHSLTKDGNKTPYELDHVIAASYIHHDAGRILSEEYGVALANSESNLVTTHWYINNIKNDHDINTYCDIIIPQQILRNNDDILKLTQDLNNKNISNEERKKIQDNINIIKEKNTLLATVDKNKLLAVKEKADKVYNSKINWSYYSSSKFLKNTATEAGKAGLSMGFRQALGLVLAELWFELKETIPRIYQNVKTNFTLENFVAHIKTTLKNIWGRIQLRFKDLLMSFKDGVLSGILGSLTSTLWNAFQTIGGNVIKLIRETWSSLVQAAKLIFFNPDKLALGDLMKELSKIIGLAVATSLGTILNQYLSTLLTFPFGDSLAAFLSALVVGLMTLGMSYFLDHSELMQKVWNYLNNLKNRYDNVLENLKEINESLDDYLINLSKTELNLNPEELRRFTDSLYNTNSELERSVLLHEEVKRRNIALPFDSGNLSSTRDWLKKL